jgi:epidermal growth factor receptor substrate 15
MQLFSIPLLPNFSSGLPAGAATATGAGAAGTPADRSGGFGDILTAEAAAAKPAQPTSKPGHASTNTPTSSRSGTNPHRPTSTEGPQGQAASNPSDAAVNGGEPMVALPLSTGSATVDGQVVNLVETIAGSTDETAEGAPSDPAAESTVQGGAVEGVTTAQPQAVAPWLAPVAAESGAMELLGLSSAVNASEDGSNQESGEVTASPAQTGRASLFASTARRASDSQTGSASASVAATGTGIASTSTLIASEGGVTGKAPSGTTAIRSGAEQVPTAVNSGDAARSATASTNAQADAAVPSASTVGLKAAGDRAVAMAKVDPIAHDATAVGVISTTASSGKAATASAATRTQDAAAVPGPMATTSPADPVAPKVAPATNAQASMVGEKFAAALNEFSNGQGSPENRGQKHSLLSGDKLVKSQSQRLGTNTAQGEIPMAASAQSTRSLIAEPEAMSFSAEPLTFDALVEEAAQGVEHTNSARKAVDVAMSLLDQAGKGTQRGVNLQFSVSGVDVAVRVEMRDDQVHTTFRTDSPELRAALAQEWQTVVSTHSADRSQKLADPVFTSTANSGSTSGDSGASQQRESSTRQSQWENSSAFARSGAAQTADAAHPAESLHVRSSRPETTRHLDAVA